MNVYNVNIIAPANGGILLDVHSTTGTSRCATFGSPHEIQQFFSSLGLHEAKVAELEAICMRLHAEEAYHEDMFLPDNVVDAIKKLAEERRQAPDGDLAQAATA